MELFNEMNNGSMQTIITKINECLLNEQPIDKYELQNSLANGSVLSDQEKLLIDKLFTKEDETTNDLFPIIDKLVPIIPTKLELEWLTEILHDPRILPIMSENLRNKLLQSIEKKPLPQDVWQQKIWHCQLPIDNPCFHDDKYLSFFQTALTALKDFHYLYYESYNICGQKYSGEAVPYKIEYCSNTNSFNLIMWNEDKNWTFKSDFATITKLELLPKHFDNSIIKAADTYVQNMKDNLTPIVLILNADKSNVFERCFAMFAAYDKEVTRLNSEAFVLKIYTRAHFDEQEIFDNILSLGSSVVVEKPLDLRQKIINSIQESFTR